MHHERFRKYGDPNAVQRKGTKRGEVQEYFYSVVLPYDGVDCLIWPFTKNAKGYGMMLCDDKYGLVTRFLCKETKGPPPTPKHEAAHSCGKGHLGCVAKRHLSWKTRVENQADRRVHGTDNRGEKHTKVKISEAIAKEIFALKGLELQKETAARFGVKTNLVACIQSGKSWGWLTGAGGSRHSPISSAETARALS
ncbi:hypothetical protein HJB80_02870 [Rhizobium lentis]|uniref:hypothetical protein n=1 Tax=Rhizobium lentis TaxID=1138194 RepID=UPI001C83664F|nr:hypothetical protein [Rhizobium lentis]MBX5131635.1 hypothetical protein [Rhizobium lentis]